MSVSWQPGARRLLIVAAAVVTIEAVVLIGLALADLLSLDSSRVTIGVGVAAFLLVYGGSLLVAMAMMLRGRWGARGPLVASQLVQLGIAWNLRGVDPDTLVVPRLSLLVALAAVVVLVCLLASPVTAAIVAAEEAEADAAEESGGGTSEPD